MCRILVHLCHTNSFHECFFTTHYETYIMCFFNNDINFSRDKALTFMSSTFTMLFTKSITKLLYKCHICTGNFVLFIAFIYLCNYLLITFIFTSHLLLFSRWKHGVLWITTAPATFHFTFSKNKQLQRDLLKIKIQDTEHRKLIVLLCKLF